tara:strand:- start:1953 stop:2168 length:216 start_codon:yes stop_codon:yes gene_type:complete
MNIKDKTLFEQICDAFDDNDNDICLSAEVEKLEKDHIQLALAQHQKNRTRAAKQLGIGRTLLIHKIKKYNL